MGKVLFISVCLVVQQTVFLLKSFFTFYIYHYPSILIIIIVQPFYEGLIQKEHQAYAFIYAVLQRATLLVVDIKHLWQPVRKQNFPNKVHREDSIKINRNKTLLEFFHLFQGIGNSFKFVGQRLHGGVECQSNRGNGAEIQRKFHVSEAQQQRRNKK